MGKPKKDLLGQRFGRLTVIGAGERPEFTSYTGLYWRCRCDCGREATVRSQSLLNGNTRSCNCLRTEALVKGRKERWKKEGTEKCSSK